MSDDFLALRKMKYSGRGITIGITPNGNPFVGYSLTGRSPPSQARKLVYDKESLIVRTQVTDEEQLKKGNPSLLIYSAIMVVGDKVIASNGAQTNLIASCVGPLSGGTEDILSKAFEKPYIENGIDLTSYEPDYPNFTNRISACVNEKECAFSILRKFGEQTIKYLHHYPFKTYRLEPGGGRIVTTYEGGNENPLLPFIAYPLEVRITSETPRDICESLYEAIGPKNGDNFRVSAAVMLKNKGDYNVYIINRFDRGE